MYASTSRQKNRKFVGDGRKDDDRSSGDFVQVSRLANPLVNEVIIGTGFKDLWNSQDPKDEKRFIDFYQNPRLAFLLNAVFGTSFPTAGRSDLVTLLLQYFAPVFSGSPGILSELLRCEPRHTTDAACGSKAVDRAQQCGGCDFRLRLRLRS